MADPTPDRPADPPTATPDRQGMGAGGRGNGAASRRTADTGAIRKAAVDASDAKHVLAEMRRVVRKGGLVMVFEHNPFNPLTRHLVNNCPIDENAVLLKSKKLLGLMGETGLSSIRSRFIIFTPIDTAFFKRFDRLIGWLPLGAQYYTIGKVPAG